MPAFFVKERVQESDMCFSNLVQQDAPTARNKSILIPKVSDDLNSPILPGLSDDVSKHCLALLPRSHFPAVGAVCKRWRSFIKSKEFITVRKLAGVLEEWLYVLTVDAEGNGSHWEVLDCLGHKHHQLRPMPGPAKAGLAWSFSMGSFWLLLVIWWLMAPAQSEQIYTNTILASIVGLKLISVEHLEYSVVVFPFEQ
ncbi:UNVERIFIED_CONTAM: F-box/kelch-repeat protein [Sesamum calycinum]|uniref:F-box/kelch-repeat protein n=1 Tax=Sesamum calycinum TaxID=2727403 RepID=A0AAW2QWW2_9LAMI